MTSSAAISAIVLAAGEGTRMRSERPKPLHLICGRPMVMHVIHSLEGLPIARTVVVVGHNAERVTKKVQEQAPTWAGVSFVEQAVQRGTGDATVVGLSSFDGDGGDMDDTSTVIVLPGDTPLLQKHTIARLVETHEATGSAATVLTARMEDPSGYGRIVRAKDGRVMRIVEQRDADEDEVKINEINTGIYAFRRDLLGPALRRISNNNSQAEYYLTDAVEVLASMGHRVAGVEAAAAETAGVNDRWQLALAERELRARTNKMWLLSGVTMLDPRQTFIDVTVSIGRDVTLFPGVLLQGDTTIGDGCEIGPQTRLVDCVVGPRAVVENTVARESEIGADAIVGPFASLDPAAVSLRREDRRVLHWSRMTSKPLERVTTKRLSLFSGRTHPALADEVATHLGIEVGDANIVEFANGEIRPRFADSIRGGDVFVMQSHYTTNGHSINDSIMEQLIMIDAAQRASAKRITAVCPFYGYARQDRKAEGREPITARMLSDMFKAAGATRMVSIDLHSGQIQGFFSGPVDHLTAMPVLEEYVRKHADNNVVIVSPDAGRVKVAERFAQHLSDRNADVAFINKRRPKGSANVAIAKEVIGDVDGRHCILTDDMIDTGGTIVSAAELLLERGAKEVWAMATHGVLSGPAVDRMKASPLERVVLTNTLPIENGKLFDKLEVLSVAKIIADALAAVFDETSVSELFGGENQA